MHPFAKNESADTQVLFFLEGSLLSFYGQWQWDFYAENVLCSDVMYFPEITFADSLNFEYVVNTLIHPEDLPSVKNFAAQAEAEYYDRFSFRVITTAGQVKTIACHGLMAVKPLEDLKNLYDWQTDAATVEMLEKGKRERQELRVKVYEQAERITDMGTWAYNTDTNEAFYSDQVYRLHGLPPQSLNAHLNTFIPFIHPDDKLIFTDAFDAAFKEQVPLHLEFRIVRRNQQERYLQYITAWIYNARGERILSGYMKDITEEKLLEEQKQLATYQARSLESLLDYTEDMAETGTWYVNLYTRKSVYSDNIYRIYGLKPKSIPTGGSFFLDFVHPEDRGLVQEAQQKMFREHVAPDVAYRITRRNGETRHLLQKGKMVINEEREVVIMGIIKDVTEEKRLNGLVLEQKNTLQLQSFTYGNVERLAGMGHWLWDMESGDIHWSDSLYLLLGLKPGFVGFSQKKLLTFIHPDDKYFFKTQLDRAFELEAENEFSFRMLIKGSMRYMKASFKLLNLDAKKYLLVLLQDVTGNQLLEQHFSERIQFVEQLTDTIQDLIFVTNNENTLITWNRQCERYFGISRDEAIGQNVFDVLPHLLDPQTVSVFEQALRGEIVRAARVPGLSRQELFDHIAVPLKNEQESITAVMHVWRNVTEDVHMREELTSRLHFIENLVESSIDCIIVLDKNMNYLYWNSRSEEYYGLQKQEVVGKNILDVFPGFKTDPNYEDFKKALKGETVQLPVQENPGRPGSYSQPTLVPLKNDREEVFAVLWMIHDVTNKR